MPELPEAETIVRGLRAHILNSRILSIDFPRARYFRPQFEEPVEHYLESRIIDIFRHGKSVIIQVKTLEEAERFLVIRLGMTGQLLLGDHTDRHTHAIFCLDSPGMRLCFRDSRQFGKMLFVKDWRPIFRSQKTLSLRHQKKAAPEAYALNKLNRQPFTLPASDPLKISAGEFLSIFWKRRGMIKAALLNQHLLVGVGNIYADESLFAARIHPKQRIQRLSKQRLLKYFTLLVKILNNAIDLGGSSISDFVGATNVLGEFQLEHRVYGRTGEKCLRRGCSGLIKHTVVSSRSTHYCPLCQRRI
ncbi:MAG: bifunctional DNA-formamidopyrimidine glycosylase/DNA-(apurinic or apyrimidinic site) lyase [Acidobacteriia bacterium]|nr:bifunctional DNA-formamidopyrimidine glycosylase/DNA-(apurinic or apyrimidinic site) lyase [Terriglobia bacterium]